MFAITRIHGIFIMSNHAAVIQMVIIFVTTEVNCCGILSFYYTYIFMLGVFFLHFSSLLSSLLLIDIKILKIEHWTLLNHVQFSVVFNLYWGIQRIQRCIISYSDAVLVSCLLSLEQWNNWAHRFSILT